MKLNCFLYCKAFPCIKSSVLFSEFLSECPPKMHTRSHYSLSSYLHKRYWKVEFDCVWLFRLLSPHQSQVSGSLSSHVKPCRLAQALESQGSGLLLPWEQVPERCCQLFPASSFAVGVWESGHHWSLAQSISLFSFLPSPALLVSDGMFWYESLMPQFPYVTSLLCHFAMGVVPSHILMQKPHSLDQQCLLLMLVSGGCLVSRMLFYGALFLWINVRLFLPVKDS